MTYEVFSVYAMSDRASIGEDMNNTVRPMITAAGGTQVDGWDVLTGPMAGKVGISSRWESLDAFGAWLTDIPKKVAADGGFADMLGRSEMIMRVLLQDVTSSGSATGKYMSSARFSFDSSPVGMDHALQLGIGAGGNGGRIMTAIAGGEFTGQVLGNFFYDSLDGFPAVLAATSSDPTFAENVAASGGQLQSRTLFQRI
jgi:hypothetical protein